MNTGIEFAEKLSKAYSETCKPLCHELNIPQTAFDILLFLANNPEYKTARDIVEIRKIKANLVSVNVDKLVNEGYLERKSVEGDRRKVNLICTEKSKEIIQEGQKLQQSFVEKLFEGMDEDTRKARTGLYRSRFRPYQRLLPGYQPCHPNLPRSQDRLSFCVPPGLQGLQTVRE